MQKIKNTISTKILITLVFIVLVSAANISAATFTVTNTNDSGAGSLRQAFADALASTDNDTIVFSSLFNTPQTITLTSGAIGYFPPPQNPSSLTVRGPGANLLTVSGNNSSRIFTFNTSFPKIISGMKLTNGNANGGGAINDDEGNLTLNDMTITNNTSTGVGGGIYQRAGTVTLNNVEVTNNTGSNNVGAGAGGGIYADRLGSSPSNLIINNSKINGNTAAEGGGLFLHQFSTAKITNSNIDNNVSTNDGSSFTGSGGGGIVTFADNLTIINSTVDGNTAKLSGGGIRGSGGGLFIYGSSISNNTVSGGGTGGGLEEGRGVIAYSNISGNRALLAQGQGCSGFTGSGDGGAITTAQSLTIYNTTFANNAANCAFGAINVYNNASVKVSNSTFTGNTGLDDGFGATGAVGSYFPCCQQQFTAITLTNTIAYNNTPNDLASRVTSGGNNIVGTVGSSGPFAIAGDQIGVNPLLDPAGLQNNGGRTKTIAIQAGSPAINAGDNSKAVDEFNMPLLFDQRRQCFARIVGGTVDIGAFERGAVNACPNYSGPAKFDFDGDGKSDISVFRPANGVWYQNRSFSGFTGVTFGQNGDLIAPADFDADGKTDTAVFRPSNGTWYIFNSSNNSFSAVQFGANGDLPRPADFDGDGKADISLFRPSNGAWYRLNSSNGSFFGTIFGQNGDKPLIADFDGDSKADITVFRSSTASFYWLSSLTGGFNAAQFGLSTDIPVPANYDGDGKSDLAVFRPSNGAWYRINSSNGGFTGTIFGQNGDIPTAADYDGDGKSDIAVFRPSNGSWYYQQSSNGGFVGQVFGISSDKPVPAAFQ